MKRLLISSLFVMLMLVGCGTNDDAANEDRNEADPDRENTEQVKDVKDDETEERKDDTDYDVSKEAADRITNEIDDIKRATVISTKNNAYVAAQLDKGSTEESGEEVTDETKKKINDIVKDVDEDIDKVYVTTNPDFANLLDEYANDFDDGKPISGMFDEITNMIERLFPQNKE